MIGFTKSQKEDIFKVLAAILHLGNIAFDQAGDAQVDRTNHVLITKNIR